MEQLKAFVATMTVWNWIALIAFLIALMSGLNALLSLRSRWRDRQATKSKESFRDYLSFLKRELARVQFYTKNPRALDLYLVHAGTHAFTWVVMALILFGFAFLFTTTPVLVLYGLSYPTMLVGLFLLFRSFSYLSDIRQIINHVRNPRMFAHHIVETIQGTHFPLEKEHQDLLEVANKIVFTKSTDLLEDGE